MSSQAQRMEEKWKKYTDKLTKSGMAPSPEMAIEYRRRLDFANIVDDSASQEVSRILSEE